MREIVCDAGPIISLSNACALWILERLAFSFIVPPFVFNELVVFPERTKHHLLSAVRIRRYFENGTLSTADLGEEAKRIADEFLSAANRLFSAGKREIKIIQRGEAEAVGLAYERGAAMCVDERTTRLLVEDPLALKEILQHRLGRRITVNDRVLDEIEEITREILVIRSVELAALAYEEGKIDIYDHHTEALKGLLYALKYSGCSVSEEEIEEYLSR